MIIDVHYHVGTCAFGRYDFSIDRQWVRDEMRQFDIQKTIVFPYRYPGSYDHLNREILNLFADENILPFARIRFNFKSMDALKYLSVIKIRSPHKRIQRALKEIMGRKGIAPYRNEEEEKIRFAEIMRRSSGIKFHDNQDGHLHENHFQYLLSFEKPIVFHINPFKLDYFLSLHAAHVRSPIVIAHLGASDGDSIYLAKTIDLLKNYDFLYTDTAAHVCANHVIPFLREVPKKILFGSDGPVVSQGSIRYLIEQTGRAMFNDKGAGLQMIADNSAAFCRAAGWNA